MAKKKVFLKEKNRDSPPHKYQLETCLKSFKAANSQRRGSQEMGLNSHAIDIGSSIPLNTGSRFQTHLGLSKKNKTTWTCTTHMQSGDLRSTHKIKSLPCIPKCCGRFHSKYFFLISSYTQSTLISELEAPHLWDSQLWKGSGLQLHISGHSLAP